jgi:anti-sigma regulatory factor (Ser/Thr protein kinase)
MATNQYSFKLKNDISELKILCQHLNHFGQVSGLSDALISEINICLDELFTNIVLYGFKDDLEHTIRFRMNLNGNALILDIEDSGIPFNPLIKREPELPVDVIKAKIGGLGIHIVKNLMDDMWYERKRGKNRLTLKKFIQATSHLYKSDNASSIPTFRGEGSP